MGLKSVVVQVKPTPALHPSGVAENVQSLSLPHVKNFACGFENGEIEKGSCIGVYQGARIKKGRSQTGLSNFDINGGEGEIRTHGTASRSVDFESTAFDHSATSPHTT